MIASRLEYLFLLGVFFLVILTLFLEVMPRLFRDRSYWISGVLFIVLCTGIEIYALKQRWWFFNDQKICGAFILGVPLEEYIVFYLIHLSAIASWNTFNVVE